MKYILHILIFSLVACLPQLAFTQDKEKKVDRKLVVVKKQIDENGNVTVDEIVTEGEDAEGLLEEMNLGEKGVYKFKIDGDHGEVLKMIQLGDEDIFINSHHGHDSEIVKSYKIIKLDEDGNKQVIEWNGEGEMPEEMKGLIEENELHFGEIHEGHHEMRMINVTADVEEEYGMKKVKIVIDNEDGEPEVIEWEGEGDIPAEIQEKLDHHNVIIHEEHGGEEIEINVTKEVEVIDGEKKVKIIIDNEEGEAEVIEWEGEGDIPVEIKEKLDQIHLEMDGDVDFEFDVDDVELVMPSNKAYLGVHIENAEEGVRVIRVEEESAAAEAGLQEGDVIQKIDGESVADIESLIASLSDNEPGDSVKIDFTRGEENTQVKAVLKERKIENVWIHRHKDHHDHIEKHGDEPMFIFKGDNDANIVKKKVIIIERIKSDEPEVAEEEVVEPRNVPQPKGKKLKLKGFNAYPNPTDGMLNVSFASDKKPMLLQMVDITGKEVYREQISNFDGYYNEDIDLSDATPGNYILYVIQNSRVFTHNLVVN